MTEFGGPGDGQQPTGPQDPYSKPAPPPPYTPPAPEPQYGPPPGVAPQYGPPQGPPPGPPPGAPYGAPAGPPQYGPPPGVPPQYGPPPGSPQYGPPPGVPFGAPPPSPYGQTPGGYPGMGGMVGPDMVSLPGVGIVKIASVGQRFGALVIDFIIFGGIAFALVLAAGVNFTAQTSYTYTTDSYGNQISEPHITTSGGSAFLAVFGVIWALGIVNQWILVGIKGQSVGKMVLGLKVLREDTGDVPGIGKAFIRWIVQGISSSCCYLGYISVFFDNSGRRQTWYDKAAGTLVTSTK